MLQCVNENTTVAPSFVTAAKSLSVLNPSVHFGAIDCSGQLPSNRTLLQRFNLPALDPANPTGYLFANSQRPLQVGSGYIVGRPNLSSQKGTLLTIPPNSQVPPKYVINPKKLAHWIEKYRSASSLFRKPHTFTLVRMYGTDLSSKLRVYVQ